MPGQLAELFSAARSTVYRAIERNKTATGVALQPARLKAMTAKEQLRNLVDDLSEDEAASALMTAERHRSDPMLRALAAAENDDEPSSPQEDDTARRAVAAYERGEALSPSELKSDLGIA